MNKLQLDERLMRIENKLLINNKTVLTIEEACSYTGYAKAYIHKLTSKRELPFSKPNGKAIFFERKNLEEWMLRNPSKAKYQIEQEAINYSFNSKKK